MPPTSRRHHRTAPRLVALAAAAATGVLVLAGPAAAVTLPPTPGGIPQQVAPLVPAPAGEPVVTAVPATPAGLDPATVDLPSPYEPQVSCDPVAKPGVLAFRDLMLGTFKTGFDDGITHPCDTESTVSEHDEGRAWDWALSAASPTDRALADHLLDWLMAKGPDGTWAWNARRFGIMYVIWNGRIWGVYNADAGWRPYSGASAHTDHVHFSFSWDGAWKRTSWWTGKPVTQSDLGPCAPYAMQAAARYTAPTYTCPVQLASLVTVTSAATAQPKLGYLSRNALVPTVQRRVGAPVTGVYDLATEAAVKTWQGAHGLFQSGVVDPATWTVLNRAASSLRTHDWTGDGFSDLLGRRTDGTLWVYPGSGTGGWGRSRQIGNGWGIFDSLVAVDGWGGAHTMGILARKASDRSLWYYPGNGAGGWGTPKQIGVGWGSFDVLIGAGDVDHDGKPDLLARRSADGALWVYPGNGAGGFRGTHAVVSGTWTGYSLFGAPGWTGAGQAGLIGEKSDGTLWRFGGSATGFDPPVQIGNGWGPYAPLVSPGDLDGDGNPDVVGRLTTDATLWDFASDGTGTFTGKRQVGFGWGAFDAFL